MAVETPEWMLDASCRGKNGDIWFPPFETTTPELNYAIARKVCNVCPVWRDCLTSGLRETYGMWGGLTPQERTPLQKESRTTHLAEHGSVVRYRQGCMCNDCSVAYATRKRLKNLASIPNVGEKLPDLKMLLDGLQSEEDGVR